MEPVEVDTITPSPAEGRQLGIVNNRFDLNHSQFGSAVHGHVVQRVVRRILATESGLEHRPFVDAPVSVQIPFDFAECVA